MTTTDIYQGMDTGAKSSSRVSNPPGGRSNFSFFGDPEPPAPARAKQSSAQRNTSNILGAPAQSAKPKSDTSSFSTLGFGTGDADSATDLAAQRAAYKKRQEASSFMFSGEENPASQPKVKAKVTPQKIEAKPTPPTVDSPATNCNEENPITNQTSNAVAASNDSPDRVSLKNAKRIVPEQQGLGAGNIDKKPWEEQQHKRSNPPGGKSSIQIG